MAKRTTHLRLSAATKARLEELRRKWEEEGAGNDWAPGEGGWHLSVDQVISILIDRDNAHRTRARKQRADRAALHHNLKNGIPDAVSEALRKLSEDALQTLIEVGGPRSKAARIELDRREGSHL